MTNTTNVNSTSSRLKIGITERGDGGLNTSWAEKLNTVNGAIIVTKNLNDDAINKILMHKDKLIVHCGCTGLGRTVYEPNVPDYKWQLNQLAKLLHFGFHPSHVVLRIDPILPTKEGLYHVKFVLDQFQNMQKTNKDIAGITRIRISVMDMYPHVRQRFAAAKINIPYGDKFYAPYSMMRDVIELLSQYPYQYETCAEPYLKAPNITQMGCISEKDLSILGLHPDTETVNPQNRNGCLCLSCKTELLSCKHPCSHKCLYCYWKD